MAEGVGVGVAEGDGVSVGATVVEGAPVGVAVSAPAAAGVEPFSGEGETTGVVVGVGVDVGGGVGAVAVPVSVGLRDKARATVGPGRVTTEVGKAGPLTGVDVLISAASPGEASGNSAAATEVSALVGDATGRRVSVTTRLGAGGGGGGVPSQAQASADSARVRIDAPTGPGRRPGE